MANIISVTAITATSATIAIDVGPANGTMDYQIGARPDFKFCVAPILTNLTRTFPRLIRGFNAGGVQYVRVRNVTSAGVVGPWSNIVAVNTPVGTPWATAPQSLMIEPAIIVVPAKPMAIVGYNTVAGHPPENLCLDAPVGWRARIAGYVESQTWNHAFEADLGGAPVDTIALLNSNIVSTATVTIKAGADMANVQGATPSFVYGPVPFRASANIPPRPGYHGLFRLPAPQSFPYWRVEISGISSGGMIHIEHAIFGVNRSSKNYSIDKTETGLDLGGIERGRSGIPLRNLGYRMRRVEFDISALTEAQYETLYADLAWSVGGTEPVFVAPNSRTGAFLHDRLLYGVISAGKSVNTHSPRFSRSFTIDSLI